MNCHGNNKNREHKKHNPMKHMLMMVLCCGLPFILIGVLPFISIGSGFKEGIAGIAPFICPVMMIFMLPMMFKSMKHGDCCSDKKEVDKEQIKIK